LDGCVEQVGLKIKTRTILSPLSLSFFQFYIVTYSITISSSTGVKGSCR
jgi:hypothetical protein